MIISCATDNNFVQHCCIMLVSLLSNNKDVEIYIIADGLSTTNEEIIRMEIESQNGTVHFCKVTEDIAKEFPMSNLKRLNHISRATYFRLLLPEILPSHVSKVIYLDCDIIVNESIEELWNIDLTNNAIAAVPEIGSGNNAERLGYPIEYGYFNAGVALMNLDYCRENKICNMFMEYIHKHRDILRYNDQDVLNGVLYDKCIHIMPMWNMTSIIYLPDLKCRGDARNGCVINDYAAEKSNARKFKRNPPVLHYVSRPKPWQNGCTHPLYGLYFHYAKKTITYQHIQPQPVIPRYWAVFKYYLYVYLVCIKQRIHKTDSSRI